MNRMSERMMHGPWGMDCFVFGHLRNTVLPLQHSQGGLPSWADLQGK